MVSPVVQPEMEVSAWKAELTTPEIERKLAV